MHGAPGYQSPAGGWGHGTGILSVVRPVAVGLGVVLIAGDAWAESAGGYQTEKRG